MKTKSTETVNVDARLIKLATEHKARCGSNSKGNRARRCFIRGQAWKLIREHYPINAEAVGVEWEKLAYSHETPNADVKQTFPTAQ